MDAPLANKTCEACHGGTPRIESDALQEYKAQLTHDWEVKEDRKLRYPFTLSGFREAMDFANKVAEIAEQQDHHPVLTIKHGQCTVVLTTHAIGGLSENDFIMAAKVEALPKH